MGKSKGTSVIGAILDLLQIAIAIGVVVLTSWRLLDVSVDVEGKELQTTCVLDGSGSSDFISGNRFCAYAIAVGILSLLVSVIFGCIRNCFKCVTLNACAASNLIAIVNDAILTVWWAVAFTLFVQRGTAANDLGWPNRSERDGVIALAFGGILAFAIDAIVTVWTFVRS